MQCFVLSRLARSVIAQRLVVRVRRSSFNQSPNAVSWRAWLNPSPVGYGLNEIAWLQSIFSNRVELCVLLAKSSFCWPGRVVWRFTYPMVLCRRMALYWWTCPFSACSPNIVNARLRSGPNAITLAWKTAAANPALRL